MNIYRRQPLFGLTGSIVFPTLLDLLVETLDKPENELPSEELESESGSRLDFLRDVVVSFFLSFWFDLFISSPMSTNKCLISKNIS